MVISGKDDIPDKLKLFLNSICKKMFKIKLQMDNVA